MNSKTFRMPIIVQVLLAILLGIIQGFFVPAWFVRIFVTFNEFFGQFIGFLVPLIILALVAESIANARHHAGRMLTVTLILVYASTFLSGMSSYFIGEVSLPYCIERESQLSLAPIRNGEFAPFFTIQLPPALDVLSALLMAFMFGLGIRMKNANAMRRGITELKDIVMMSIEKVLVPLLPLYIFGVFTHMSASGEVLGVVRSFVIVIAITIAVMFLWALILYFVAAVMTRNNPFSMMIHMAPAVLFAFATSSSAATIPISLQSAAKLADNKATVSFVIPLCANLHIPAVAIQFVICAMAVMMIVGQPIELATFIPFVLLLTMTCVAAPGVPGGVVAVLPVLANFLNFTPEMQAICLSLGIAMDAPITGANVLCDGAICAIVDKTTTGDNAPEAHELA